MPNLIDKIKVDPLVYYIYDVGLPIFGIEGDSRYLIIVDEKWSAPPEMQDEPIKWYYIQEWFKMVLDCHLLPWICACINKKYVIKEHVKLMMTTDPLKLRKNIDFELITINSDDLWQMFMTIIDIKFANQIIENHKIVNFTEGKSDYQQLINSEEPFEIYKQLTVEPYKRLCKYTDGYLVKDKLKDVKYGTD